MASDTASRRAEPVAAPPAEAAQPRRSPLQPVLYRLRRLWRGVRRLPDRLSLFSSLTRRIVAVNLFGLVAFVSGILYLNQFRAGLIEARLESLTTQGQIIATAVSASVQLDRGAITLDLDKLLRDYPLPDEPPAAADDPASLDFQIDPERVTPVLRRLVSPTQTRARIYDHDGYLVVDSRSIWWREQRAEAEGTRSRQNILDRAIDWVASVLTSTDVPIYKDIGQANGRQYPEVVSALGGTKFSMVRRTTRGELIVSVAVPVSRDDKPIGALLLSTQAGDIDGIIHAERIGIFRMFLVAAGVMTLMSILLAGTIAGPLRRLSAAADRVRRSVKAREEIPDFADRQDEVGHLSRAFRDMTSALYSRLDAIEHFAADVAHELKNPLTSLRSAVETLPLAKTETSRARLLEVIQHDVRRLDRLISDISDASRLDAELAREDAEPVDLWRIAEAVVSIQRDLAQPRRQTVRLVKDPKAAEHQRYFVMGHDSRLGQVLTNLLDNARSFTPDGGTVTVTFRRAGLDVVVTVEDDGPGIRPDALEKIFERFYTDRPEGESFGNNSGLGLAISRQIVEAHRGTVVAENRVDPADPERVLGARFIVTMPAP
jgi:two-component system sensor histidine kinase ChvG